MSLYTDIQSSLNQRLSIMPGLPSTVIYENTQAEPTVDEIYLRAWLLPVPTQYLCVGKDTEGYYQGIYQVDVLGPQGNGWASVYAMSDTVIAHFPRGLLLTYGGKNVRIERAYPSPGRQEDNRYKIVISIDYCAFI